MSLTISFRGRVIQQKSAKMQSKIFVVTQQDSFDFLLPKNMLHAQWQQKSYTGCRDQVTLRTGF